MKKLIYILPLLIWIMMICGAKDVADSFDKYNIGLVCLNTASLDATYEQPIYDELVRAGHTVYKVDDSQMDDSSYTGTTTWSTLDAVIIPFSANTPTTPDTSISNGIGDVPVLVMKDSLMDDFGFEGFEERGTFIYISTSNYDIIKTKFDSTFWRECGGTLSVLPYCIYIDGDTLYWGASNDKIYKQSFYSSTKSEYGSSGTGADQFTQVSNIDVKDDTLFVADDGLGGGGDRIAKVKFGGGGWTVFDALAEDYLKDVAWIDDDSVFYLHPSDAVAYKGLISSEANSDTLNLALQYSGVGSAYPGGFHFDRDNGKLYFIDSTLVMRTNKTFTPEDSITGLQDDIEDLFFENRNEYLYWIDNYAASGDYRLFRSKFGGSVDSAFGVGVGSYKLPGPYDIHVDTVKISETATQGYVQNVSDSITSVFTSGLNTFYSSSGPVSIYDSTNNYKSSNVLVSDVENKVDRFTVAFDTLNGQKRALFGYYDASKLTHGANGGWTLFNRCLGRLVEADQDSIFDIGIVFEIPTNADSNLKALKNYLETNMQKIHLIDSTYHDSTTYDGTNLWSSLDMAILYSNSLTVSQADSNSKDSLMTYVPKLLGLDPYNAIKFDIATSLTTVTQDQDSLQIKDVYDILTDDYVVDSLIEIYSTAEGENFFKPVYDTYGQNIANADSANSNFESEGGLSIKSNARRAVFPWRLADSWASDGWDLFEDIMSWILGPGLLKPTNVSISAVNTDSISATWTDNSSEETGFLVYLEPGGSYSGSSAIIKTLSADDEADTLSPFWPPNGKFFIDIAVYNNQDTVKSGTPDSTWVWSEIPPNPLARTRSDTSLYYTVLGYSLGDAFSDASLLDGPVWSVQNGIWSIESPPYRLRVEADSGNNAISIPYGSSNLIKDVEYRLWFHFNDSLDLETQYVKFHVFQTNDDASGNGYGVDIGGDSTITLNEYASGVASALIDTTWSATYKWHNIQIFRDWDETPADTTVTWYLIIDSDTLNTATDDTYQTTNHIVIEASDKRIWFDNFYIRGLSPSANHDSTEYAIQDSSSGLYIQRVASGLDTLGASEDWNTWVKWGSESGRTLKITANDSVYLRTKARDEWY